MMNEANFKPAELSYIFDLPNDYFYRLKAKSRRTDDTSIKKNKNIKQTF